MKENDRTRGHLVQVGHESLKIEPQGSGGEVAVSALFQAGSLEDSVVVAPSWVWEVNLASGHVLRNKFGNHAESTSAGESLNGGDAGWVRGEMDGRVRRRGGGHSCCVANSPIRILRAAL